MIAADAVQSTAASQPLLLAHNGASSDNYWWQVPSLPTNNCQTPYQASYNLTSYCDIRIKVDLNINATGQPDYPFLFGWNNANGLAINNNGTLFFFLNGSGVASTTATISRTYSGWLRVVKNIGVYTYYTSTDGIDWTILQTLNASTTNLSVANQPLIVGSTLNDARSCGMVKYYRCQLYSSTTLLADFNPATYNASTSQTAWTSATGEVWTISTGTAATGYKGVLVDRTIVMSDGVDDLVQNLTVLRGNVCSQYLAYKTENASGGGASFLDCASISYQNSFAPESANMKLYMNGSLVGLSKALGTTLALFTATNNQGVLNTLQRNNDTEVSNTSTPALSGTGITIGRNAVGGGYQKGNLNTYICITGADNATTRTATYNLIRSLNNNAF